MKLTAYLDKFDLLDRVHRAAGTEWGQLRKWDFTINHRAKGRFGQCNPRKKRVEVTSEYFVGGEVKTEEYKDFINTLLHETAHAIVFERYGLRAAFKHSEVSAHGPEWKAIMRQLGANPSRTGASKILNKSMAAKRAANPPKHIYTCKDCGHEFKKKRLLKDADTRYHGGCKRKPNGGKLQHQQIR